jgi:hypothetical protein
MVVHFFVKTCCFFKKFEGFICVFKKNAYFCAVKP